MSKDVRLIDANALEKDVRAYADKTHLCGHIELANGILKAVDRVDEAPTIDAVPVVHARWKEIGADKRGRGGIFECTTCCRCRPNTSKYCPNCGAKMDGEEHT